MTINGAEAVQVIRQLQPSVAIPMHYRTKELGLMGLILSKVDKFLAAAGTKGREVKELDISSTSLKDCPAVITFQSRSSL